MSPEQLPLFQLDDQFIFVFRSILTSGLASKIKPNGLMVYMTMKSYAFTNGPRAGMSDISIDRLVKITGVGETAVKNAIKTLLDNKYISVVPSDIANRRRLYKIYDLLPYENKDRSIQGVLVAPYHPYELREQRQEIISFSKTGRLKPGTSITNIVIQGDVHFHLTIDKETISATMKGGITKDNDMDKLRNSLGTFIVDRLLESNHSKVPEDDDL